MAQNLVVMPQDELIKLLRQAVREELDGKPATTAKNWLTSTEIATHFDVSEGTIKNWIKHGDCPHYDVGGVRRFELSAVDRWFRNRTERSRSRRREVLPAR
jgi:excisionase family DNA binding protein